MRNRGRVRVLTVAMAVVVCALVGPGSVEARVPEPDHTFYGAATIAGVPVFDSLITVERRVGPGCVAPGAEVLASFLVPANPAPGEVYMLRVPIDSIDPADPGTARKDDPVCFFIDDVPAGAGVVGERGEATPLDLDTDFDAAVARLSIGDVQLFEGNAGAVQWMFTVSVAPVSPSEIFFTYETQNGSAEGGASCSFDFIEVPSFPAAQETIPALASSLDVTVDVCGDAGPLGVEPDETFFVNLVDVAGAVIEDGQAMALIRDDDADPRLTIDDVTVTEGNGASVNAIFAVSLSRPADQSVFVDYVTVSGTAEEDIDYALTSGTLEITAPQQGGTISVEVFADAINEGAEGFSLVLSNARLEGPTVALVIDDDSGVGTITDDEHFLTWDQRWRDGLDGVEGMDSPVAAVISPNTMHVYVAGQADDAIAIFQRATGGVDTGRLTFLDSVADGPTIQGIAGISALALAPDGKFLYATGATSSAVAVFDRNRLVGSLDFIQVLADGDLDGGATIDGLSSAAAIAVSPALGDGHVYVASPDDDAIAVFARDPFSGLLSFVETVANDAAGITGLAGVSALALSPDGVHLYAAGELENSVVVLSREPVSGVLTFVERVEDGVNGVDGLARASSVALSPDGAHVYVTGRNDHALAVFSRNAGTGELTFLEAQVDGAAPVDGLRGASSVAVGPAGRFVYATGFLDDAVAVFDRDANPGPTFGRLDFIEARRNTEVDVDGIARPTSVVVSNTDLEVYVTGSESDSVAVFFVDDVPPTNPTALDSTSHGIGVPSAVTQIDVEWSGAADAESGVGGYSVLFDNNATTDVDTVVDVDHGPDPNAASSAVLADGSWYFHLRACDRAGNCDAATMHLGPLVIDATPPPPPEGVSSTSHGAAPSQNSTIDVRWVGTSMESAVADGRAGYVAWFDANKGAVCNRARNIDAGAAALQSAALANGTWYFHICSVDAAGNASQPVHAGPFVVAVCRDEDGDGFGLPGAATCPRGEAEDCDDRDAEVLGGRTWFADLDGDGYGDAAAALLSCAQPDGFVDESGDCDDAQPNVHPAATEECANFIDDDCNGHADALDPCCNGAGRPLDVGWNFVGADILLAAQDPAEAATGGVSAEQVCSAIRLGGGSPTHVAGHDGGDWQIHACGVDDGADFGVEVGKGYFVLADRPSRWCSAAAEVAKPLELGMNPDWNTFALPEWATGASAAQACGLIESAGGLPVEIVRYVDGGWQSHRCGLPQHDFGLEPGVGYLVQVEAPSRWPLYGALSKADPGRYSEPLAAFDGARALRADGDKRIARGGCPLRVVNRRATGFSIVWATPLPTAGFVRFGADADALDGSACDVHDDSSDCSVRRRAHYVTVTGLLPDSVYHVEMVQDGERAGEAFEVTTGPVLDPANPDTLYGRVALDDPAKLGEGAYVCVARAATNPEISGEDNVECDWIGRGDEGYWSVSLDNLRTEGQATDVELLVETCGPTIGCDARIVRRSGGALAIETNPGAECACLPGGAEECKADKALKPRFGSRPE